VKKFLSPWFHTAHLLNGIRKTVSEIEAARATTEERRGSRFDHSTRQSNERPQSRG
jgi:hypothetical protein